MKPILTDAIAAARGVVRRELALVAVGLLGITMAAGVALVIATRGPIVPPEGFLHKPLTFDLAVGIYVLTLAALAPLAGFSRWGGAVWRGGVATTSLYGFGVETMQTIRGIDPRFSRIASPTDNVLGLLFALDAILIMTFFVVFAVKLFRRRSIERPLVRLGARYGAATVVLGGFVAGVWMSANQGRTWGAGSLLPLHALGFHGLQAVPLVAWLLERSRPPAATVRRWVHAAGLLWLGALAAVAVQTWRGRAVAEPSPMTFLALAMLAAWGALVLAAALRRPALDAQPARP